MSTLSEQCASYLLKIGVTPDQIKATEATKSNADVSEASQTQWATIKQATG